MSRMDFRSRQYSFYYWSSSSSSSGSMSIQMFVIRLKLTTVLCSCSPFAFVCQNVPFLFVWKPSYSSLYFVLFTLFHVHCCLFKLNIESKRESDRSSSFSQSLALEKIIFVFACVLAQLTFSTTIYELLVENVCKKEQNTEFINGLKPTQYLYYLK